MRVRLTLRAPRYLRRLSSTAFPPGAPLPLFSSVVFFSRSGKRRFSTEAHKLFDFCGLPRKKFPSARLIFPSSAFFKDKDTRPLSQSPTYEGKIRKGLFFQTHYSFLIVPSFSLFRREDLF